MRPVEFFVPRPNWHWLVLAGAIAIEVAATTAMKQAALSGAVAGQGLTLGGVALSWLLPGLAALALVGVAGIGLILVPVALLKPA